MALNQRAVNEEVVNGGPVQRNVILVAYIYVNQVYSYVSGAINSFFLNANPINSASTPDAYLNSSITKQTNKYLLSTVLSIIALVFGYAFNKVLSVVSTTTSTLVKLITTTKTVISTAVVTLIKSLTKLFSITSTNTTTLTTVTSLLKTLTATVSNSVSLVKQIGKLLVSSIVSSIATITKISSYIRTLSVTSIVIPTIRRYIGKIVLEIEVVASTIITATNRLVTLLAYSTSSVNLKKGITKLIPLVTSTVIASISFIKSLLRTITASVSSTVTLLSGRFYYRTLSAISTVTAILQNTIVKTLTISVNCGIILSKLINKYINTTSTAIASLLANAVSFINYPVDRLIYAADKIREVTVIKFRTIFIDKDTRV
jgi:hypothetical protein